MSDLIRTLALCGDQLLCGVTIVLGFGGFAVYLVREPVCRQRLGEITVAGTLLCIAAAPFPMPWALQGRRVDSDRRVKEFRQPGPPLEAFSKDTWKPGATADAAERTLAARTPRTNQNADKYIFTSLSLPKNEGDSAASPSLLPYSIREMFSRIYIFGVLITAFWLLFGRLWLLVAVRGAKRPPAWLLELYGSLPPRRKARVLITGRGQPMSFGVLRPTILLPASICHSEDSELLGHVLRHEQVHVDRRDAWGHLVLNLGAPLLYFHPVYWWIRAQVTFCRELIADDQACAPRTRAAYVDCLLRVLQRSASARVLRPAGSLGVFRSPFSRRMEMLIERSEPLSSHATRSWLVYAILFTALGVAAAVSVFGIERSVWAQELGNEPPASSSPSRELQDEPDDDTDAEPHVDSSNDNITRGARPAQGSPAPDDELAAPAEPEPVPSPMPPLPSMPPAPADTGSTAECVVTAHETELAFPTSGILESVEINEGDEVTRGQLLARLDDEEAKNRVSLAVKNYELAKARAESVIQSKIAETNLEAAKYEYQQAIESEKRIAGTVTTWMIRRLRSQRDKAAFELERAREDATLSAKEALAKSELVKIAKNMLSARRLVAPSDGIVIKVHRNPGSFASEGATICTIIDMRRLYIEGTISRDFLSPQGRVQGNPKVIVYPAVMPQGRGRITVQGKPNAIVYPARQGEGIVTTAQIQAVSQSQGEGQLRFRGMIENARHDGAWLISPGMKAVVRFTEFPSVPASPDEPVSKRPVSDPQALLWGGLPSSASSQAEVVAAMQELVEFAEENLARVETRASGGTEGGEAVNLHAARYFLHHAKGRLAVARQDTPEARKQLELAVAAATDWFSAAKASYDIGVMDVAQLQRAAAARAAARYWLATLNDSLDE